MPIPDMPEKLDSRPWLNNESFGQLTPPERWTLNVFWTLTPGCEDNFNWSVFYNIWSMRILIGVSAMDFLLYTDSWRASATSLTVGLIHIKIRKSKGTLVLKILVIIGPTKALFMRGSISQWITVCKNS